MLWIVASVATLVLALASIAAAFVGPSPYRVMKRAAARERRENPAGWWRLEFIDPEKPDGHDALGVAYVEGYGVASAALRARKLGINPGGIVHARETEPADLPPTELRERLIHGVPV